MNSFRILTINPGSTSTKIAVYDDDKEFMESTIRHDSKEIDKYDSIIDQYEFRKHVILSELQKNKVDINTLSAVVGRGGLLAPMEGGTYPVNKKMIDDLKTAKLGDHASNLGGLIADEISAELGIPAFIVDPVVVDEMQPIARISGSPLIKRISIFHALNQKSVARRYAESIKKPYNQVNLIVAHLGGGVSVGAHEMGMVVDVNNALDGEGPFSPERSGGLPVGDLAKLCYSGKYSHDDIKKMIKGQGGLTAYLGTNNGKEIEDRVVAGDKEARLILGAMCYQVAKEIGAAATVLKGRVDAIILTGGLAYGKFITDFIEERVKFIAPVIIMAGEDEMVALSQGALRVLRGKEQPKDYTGE